jgi:acetylornithine deacetylase/succinyl-diaminopimelate desuccinylase-like protein
MTANSLDLAELLATLVGFPTETRRQEESTACFRYVNDFLDQCGFTVQPHHSNGYPSVVATSRPTKQPKVLLQAHMDVVPAKPTAYKLRQADGKLYGRGVFDMKFAAACFLKLANELKNNLTDYDFGIMLTSDEEIGGRDGVKYLLDQGYDTEICILPDGGADWQIETSCNGVWFLGLTASGQTAHGSRPWEGENAIDNLMAAIADIREVFGKLDASKCSLTVSRIGGGEANNQVPDTATATLDMRFQTMKHYQAKRAKIEAIGERHQLELKTLSQVDPIIVDLTEPHIASFLHVAEEVSGQSIGHCHSLGASDARYFAQRNIPTILIRPTGGGAHADEEWIDAAELQQFYDVIKAYVVQTAKIA